MTFKYEGSLVGGKLYRMIPDAKAAADELVKIIDKDEEDYLYPAKFFVPLEIPPATARRLRGKRCARLQSSVVDDKEFGRKPQGPY